MKPKENSDQRKKRKRREAREAKQANAPIEPTKPTTDTKEATGKRTVKENTGRTQTEKRVPSQNSTQRKSATPHKPRRTREPAAAV
jgi:hypothetical protein